LKLKLRTKKMMKRSLLRKRLKQLHCIDSLRKIFNIQLITLM